VRHAAFARAHRSTPRVVHDGMRRDEPRSAIEPLSRKQLAIGCDLATQSESSFVASVRNEFDNAKSEVEALALGCTFNESMVAKVVVSSRRVSRRESVTTTPAVAGHVTGASTLRG